MGGVTCLHFQDRDVLMGTNQTDSHSSGYVVALNSGRYDGFLFYVII